MPDALVVICLDSSTSTSGMVPPKEPQLMVHQILQDAKLYTTTETISNRQGNGISAHPWVSVLYIISYNYRGPSYTEFPITIGNEIGAPAMYPLGSGIIHRMKPPHALLFL